MRAPDPRRRALSAPRARAFAGRLLALGLALGCSGDDGAPARRAAASTGPDPAPPAASAPRDLQDVARAYAGDLAREPSDTDWTGGDAAKGGALYVAHCGVCHGPTGAGDGLAAAALNPKPRDFRDGTFYFDADADGQTGGDTDLARVILEGPSAFGGSNAMQGWKDVFGEDEVRHLVAHLRALSRR